MAKVVVAPNPPEGGDKVVLLTGAGASAYLGLRTLESIVDPKMGVRISLNARVSDIIQSTWIAVLASGGASSTFEELIGRLNTYLSCTKLMAGDHVFKTTLGPVPSHVMTGEFARIWEDALIECYGILLEFYGPNKVNKEKVEFRNTIKFLKNLAEANGGKLHIFTTNYDCSYHVIASHTDELSFITHIENVHPGYFRDIWYYTRPDLKDKNIPQIYLHRLHGCVAWFSKSEAPYGLYEVFGAGDELTIDDPRYLNHMCIKLVSSEQIGANPAFSLAFNEFYDQLKSCQTLLVWGHSFRDVQVLRTIKNAADTRTSPLEILYLDEYMTEKRSLIHIRETLAGDPLVVGSDIKPVKIPWTSNDGHDQLIPTTLDALGKI